MFMFATASIICGYKFDVSVLVVPVATLFAITSLRASMPGAPDGFGTPNFSTYVHSSLFNSAIYRCYYWWTQYLSGWSYLVFNLNVLYVADYVGLLPCLALMSMTVRRFPKIVSKICLYLLL